MLTPGEWSFVKIAISLQSNFFVAVEHAFHIQLYQKQKKDKVFSELDFLLGGVDRLSFADRFGLLIFLNLLRSFCFQESYKIKYKNNF